MPRLVSANVEGSGNIGHKKPLRSFGRNSAGAGVGLVGVVYWKIADLLQRPEYIAA